MTRRSTNRRTVNRELAPYMGPIHLGSNHGLNDRTIRVGMAYVEEAVTLPNGNLYKLFSDGNLQNCPAWNQYRSEYSEYRVLAWHVKFQPKYYNNNSPAGVVGESPCLGAWAVYHENSVAFSDVVDLISSPTFKLFHSGRPNVQEIRMRGTEEMAWRPTVATTTPGLTSICCTAPGGGAETSYGLWYIEFVVEFRSRK